MGELLHCSSRYQGKSHPEWSENTVIYELNIRQFTAEGTFSAAKNHLKRLADLGVGIIWVMPIFPIGKERRKGSLGSYYSIADFGNVNPEFGTFDDFHNFVQEAHNKGIRVILDWVTNHTARDAKWIKEHPKWYVWEDGEIATPFDWSDTAKLDYDNSEMRREMVEMLKFWLTETDIDGFRMDMAMLVPIEFWRDTIPELEAVKKDIFMLAEAQGNEFHKAGFDATYSWDMHHLFNSIAKKDAGIEQLCNLIKTENQAYSRDAIRMQFTSNHDENSWNGTEFERLGEGVNTFAALSYILNGVPLIYSGQEVGLQKKLLFFDKDEIDWSGYENDNLYQKLGEIKKHPALNSAKDGADLVKMYTSCENQIFAIKRKTETGEIVIALFNLSDQQAWFKVYDDDFNGEFNQVGCQHYAYLKNETDFFLPAWGWFIYYK